jgi:diguanylate cyclase (GGDEF)-like protein
VAKVAVPHRGLTAVLEALGGCLDDVPVAVLALDESGAPVLWSREAEALLGPDVARLDLHALEGRVAQEPWRLTLRTAPGTGPDGAAVTWVVVTEAGGDRNLLEVLSHQALHDHLTGLPNRALLEDRISQALARAARSGSCVAIAFLDLDHFKLINDTQGHAEGDALLRSVAERLSSAVRSGDTVARFGGDEFVVVCEEVANAEEATQVADRLRTVVELPISLGGEDVYVSASLGVAVGSPTSTPEELLRDADAAMYHAKVEGRARTELFDKEMRTRAEARRHTEKALRRALEDDEFFIVYQPIVSLEAGWVEGVEALVRWEDPERGVILPDDFVAVAEETGLVVPLGVRVLDEACRQLSAWRSEVPHVPLSMSVNVSVRQLRSRFTESVAAVLARHSVEPHRVVLEITEGVLMTDPFRCLLALEELKELGVRIAIDDFGVGCSSLDHLKRFPIDMIKIDRAFIGGLGTDPHDSAIVSAILGIARALKVSVVAEGVETSQQLYALRHLACQHAQGYHFARPMPADELAQLLKGGARW